MKTGKTTGKRKENTRGLLLLAAMTMLMLAVTGGTARAQEEWNV